MEGYRSNRTTPRLEGCVLLFQVHKWSWRGSLGCLRLCQGSEMLRHDIAQILYRSVGTRLTLLADLLQLLPAVICPSSSVSSWWNWDTMGNTCSSTLCTYAIYFRCRNNGIPDKQSARFEEADHRESRSVPGAIDGLDSVRIRPDKKSGLKRVSPPATISDFFSFASRRLSSYRIIPPLPPLSA